MRRQAVARSTGCAVPSDCSEPRPAHAENVRDLCARGENEPNSLWPQPRQVFHAGVGSYWELPPQQWGLLFRSTISISTVTSWTGKDRTCNIKGCSRKYWLLWDLAGPSCVPQYTGLPHEALTTKEKQTNLEFPTVTKVLSSLQGQSSWDWYLKQS